MKTSSTTILLLCAIFLMLQTPSAFAISLENGLGGDAGFGENTLARNDDGSTSFIDLSSIFSNGLDFFGTNYSGLYINNNGNVTFGSAMDTFTPYALTGATGNPIITPYFADVDTRGGAATPTPGGNSTGSNLVYWDIGTSSITVTWDDVGYYNSKTDKLNAYQLKLTNRDDTGNGNFDIWFIYEDINWTTGDASGGSGGLGGTVARAGWNSGNGTDYYEISQSGNQEEMLNLENFYQYDTGVWLFTVRGGQVQDPFEAPVSPEPGTLTLFLLMGLGGLITKRFKG